MARGRIKHRPMAEINVVPYIDVMLVLLIIFMVTAPLLMQGVKVDLPEAPSDPVENQDPEPLIVSINADGDLFLTCSDFSRAARARSSCGARSTIRSTRPSSRPISRI